jgi:probable rRNA maturation factor
MAKPNLPRREPCFPSPRPSPQGRGSTAASVAKSSPPGDRSQPAETRSLSPRERARVRGRGVFNCIDTAQRTITLRNRQTTQRLNLRLLRRITRALLLEAWPHGNFDLAIYVVAELEMIRLNETYLRHQGSTDVITFDYAEEPALLHGEIFVCLDEAVSQARRFRTTWQSELMRYVVHGVLHLLGYDDAASRARQKMKAAEDALVRHLARQFELHRLGVTA